MNRDNLIPNMDKTPEKRIEQARKAGKASGVARRRKSQMSKSINLMLNGVIEITDKTKESLANIGYDIDKRGNPTALDMMIASIAARAISGDLNAAEFLARYGLIPDIKTSLEMERLDIQRETYAAIQDITPPFNNLVDAIRESAIGVNTASIPELNTDPPPKKDEYQIIDETRSGLYVFFVFDEDIKGHPLKLRINGDTYPVVSPPTPDLPHIGIESTDSFIGKTAKLIGG